MDAVWLLPTRWHVELRHSIRDVPVEITIVMGGMANRSKVGWSMEAAAVFG